MTPLVLVHGFLGGSEQWRLQREALGSQIDIITPDLPGFGKNTNVDAPSQIDTYANFVLDELTKQGVEKFHLLGHSMGGMIVQEMTALAPERIGKLILYGTAAESDVAGRFETYEESKRRARADGPRETARRIAASWFVNYESAEQYEACAQIAEKASLQAIIAGIDAFSSWSRVENLPNVANETLIIWGEHDRSYAWRQIERLWTSIPNSSLAVVPGCAHAVHLEMPVVFNEVIARFLSD